MSCRPLSARHRVPQATTTARRRTRRTHIFSSDASTTTALLVDECWSRQKVVASHLQIFCVSLLLLWCFFVCVHTNDKMTTKLRLLLLPLHLRTKKKLKKSKRERERERERRMLISLFHCVIASQSPLPSFLLPPKNGEHRVWVRSRRGRGRRGRVGERGCQVRSAHLANPL